MKRIVRVVMLIGLPQLLAGGDVEERDCEKGDRENDHEKVGHG
jgi:hypothetical protein